MNIIVSLFSKFSHDMYGLLFLETMVLILKDVVGQLRQEYIESHRLMLELRARTERRLEEQKALEKLQTTNAMLEQSQVGVIVVSLYA